MRFRHLTAVLALALLAIGQSQAATTPRKPVLIVSGTAVGFAGPSIPLVEELVIHNDGLVTLETTSGTEACRTLRRFVNPIEVEKLRAALIAAGAFLQTDYSRGQTADLPHTTVTLFRGLKRTRVDETTSFTYERLPMLPKRLSDIRRLIQRFTESAFPDFKTNGCAFPF